MRLIISPPTPWRQNVRKRVDYVLPRPYPLDPCIITLAKFYICQYYRFISNFAVNAVASLLLLLLLFFVIRTSSQSVDVLYKAESGSVLKEKRHKPHNLTTYRNY